MADATNLMLEQRRLTSASTNVNMKSFLNLNYLDNLKFLFSVTLDIYFGGFYNTISLGSAES